MSVTAADRSLAVYRRAVEKEFAFLKGTEAIEHLHARSLPLPDGAGLLVPVCELHADDEQTIALLARWRDANQLAFPTRFEVTDEGTRTWLRRTLLDVPDRILFLVADRHGHPIGHLGFAHCLARDGVLEIDNVVRGEPAAPGLMGVALDELCEWAEDMFLPEAIVLRVLDDNEHALAFYRRHGWVEVGSEPAADGLRYLVLERRVERAVGDELILTAGPMIGPREPSYALDAARHGWNRHHSDYVTAFERGVAEIVGCRHALATSSGTGAIHLALAALGLGPGDEVIVPDLTWVATASAVAYTGATPVFADVEPDSWCLDAASAEALVTARTKAIVPVHLYGHPADMDAVLAVADRHGLHVVEDAAPALGAEVRGRRVGALGDAGAFSFQGAKLVVSGEGGMLCTDDDELYERARLLWLHGCSEPDRFWVTELGYKYRLSNVQAAVGLGQVERADELVEAKRRIFSWYEEELDGVDEVELNRETSWARSIYWMPSILLREDAPVGRDRLRVLLRERHNVDTRSVFPPIGTYPIWGRAHEPGPVAARIGARALNLPSGVRLRREHVAHVGAAVRAELGR